MNANDHPYKVTAVDPDEMTANDHPIKVNIEGGVVTPAEFEELEAKVAALSTDLSYKGSVENYSDLPETAQDGDTYLVSSTGVLYTWANGSFIALNEASGMREVTSADFNWPTANPDGVATWLLPDGVYFSKATKLYFNTSTSVTGNRSFIKSTTGNGNSLTASFYGDSGGNNVNVYYTNTNGTDAWSNTIASLADIYADPSTKKQVRIGNNATADKNPSVAVGDKAYCTAQYGVALGPSSHSQKDYSVAIGYKTYVNSMRGVALGEGAVVDTNSLHSVALGAGTWASGRGVISAKMRGGYAGQGYNGTDYHLLTGLYDGQSDHDAVNLSQLNGRVIQNAGAPTTSTVGTVGKLLEDTTNGKLYICTAVSGSTYTWGEVGAGSSISNNTLYL